MIGDLMGMMGKLKETQEKVEATKKRLDTVFIEEKSNDSLLRVSISANREIKSIDIDTSLFDDQEQLEDYLVITLNKAITKASEINETEINAVAKEGMPNIPGIDLFKQSNYSGQNICRQKRNDDQYPYRCCKNYSQIVYPIQTQSN